MMSGPSPESFPSFEEVLGMTVASFNDSNRFGGGERQHLFSYQLRYGVAGSVCLVLSYGLAFLLGCFGNIAVVLVVWKSASMRSPTNLFIANLAIADLLVNVVCVPFTLIGNMFEEWIFGILLCKVVTYLQGSSVSASVYTLITISMERCSAIAYPLSGPMSRRKCRCVVLIIWTTALIINLPWLFVFTTEQVQMESGWLGEVCVELWPSQQTENMYFAFANLTICFLGPVLAISVCFIIIWRTVNRRTVLGEDLYAHQNLVIQRSKIKVTKMILVVMITFTLSWTPLYILFCYVKFSGETNYSPEVQRFFHVCLPIAQWLGAFNSSINPILYAFMNEKFRIGFKALLYRCNNKIGLRKTRNQHNSASMKSLSRNNSSGKTQLYILEDSI